MFYYLELISSTFFFIVIKTRKKDSWSEWKEEEEAATERNFTAFVGRTLSDRVRFFGSFFFLQLKFFNAAV